MRSEQAWKAVFQEAAGKKDASVREVRALACDGGMLEACRLCGNIGAFPNHLHDHYVVGALYEGRRALTMNGRLYALEPGDVFLVNPAESHACDPLEDASFSYRSLNVPTSFMEALPSHSEDGNGCSGGLPRFSSPVLRDFESFERLDGLFAFIEQGKEVEAKREVVAVLPLLFAAADIASEDASRPFDAKDPVAIARAFIDAHFAERIMLEDVAAVVQMSRYALVRLFKKELGITPGRYLSAVRVMHAKSQLEQGVVPATVACAVGFADQAHLGRVFRSVTGYTPANYRCACEKIAS